MSWQQILAEAQVLEDEAPRAEETCGGDACAAAGCPAEGCVEEMGCEAPPEEAEGRTPARGAPAYYAVASRRVLNRLRGKGLPCDRSLNPYLNCELACAYCYARDFARRRQAKAASFEREVYAKLEAPEQLRKELRADREGGPIALGTATDPYQPLELRRGLTRRLLEALVEVEGQQVVLMTKSDLVLRDLDLLRELARVGELRVELSLLSTDAALARTLEPGAPSPERRLRAVERLARAGITVGVACMPILPGLTDGIPALRRVVCGAKAAGARFLRAGVLELRAGAREPFLAWLAREHPRLVYRYRRFYRRGSQAPAGVRERVEAVLRNLRMQYRLPAWEPFTPPPPAPGSQLELFGEATRALPLAGAA